MDTPSNYNNFGMKIDSRKQELSPDAGSRSSEIKSPLNFNASP